MPVTGYWLELLDEGRVGIPEGLFPKPELQHQRQVVLWCFTTCSHGNSALGAMESGSRKGTTTKGHIMETKQLSLRAE